MFLCSWLWMLLWYTPNTLPFPLWWTTPTSHCSMSHNQLFFSWADLICYFLQQWKSNECKSSRSLALLTSLPSLPWHPLSWTKEWETGSLCYFFHLLNNSVSQKACKHSSDSSGKHKWSTRRAWLAVPRGAGWGGRMASPGRKTLERSCQSSAIHYWVIMQLLSQLSTN